jgi:VWFA-related protein
MAPVVVRNRDGHAVTDLGKEDFQLFDKGKLKEISSFSVERPAQGTNLTAWVFDDVQVSDLGDFTRLRAAAIRQVSALPPGDRAGIFTTSCRVLLDFTNSRAKLREALSRLEFQPVSACTASKVQVAQLAVLSSAVRRMAALPAQRSIVFTSPGFLVGPDGARDQADLVDSAIRSKVAIHVLDVGGATSPAVLAELAHGTGGTYVASGNDFDKAFHRLATPESYYVLGFAPSQEADGGFHQLKVRLKGSRKLDVQARNGYFAGRKASGPVDTVAKPPSRELLADAIQSPGAAAKQPVPLRLVAQRMTPAGTTVAPAAAPEESANTAEITSRDEPMTFRTETNLVLVPVVVRDAEGHAVGNLRKEDFQFTDKGKRRDIARFASQKSGPMPKFIAYLFDDIHLTAEDLARARDALRQQIASLQPRDRVGIFTTSGTTAPLDFTGDRAKVEPALLKLRPNPTSRPAAPACPNLSYYLAAQVAKGDKVALELATKLAKDCTGAASQAQAVTMIVEAGEQESRISLAVVRDLARRMSTLPGQRSIILVSPGFYLTGSLLPDQTIALDRAIHANVVIGAIDARGALNARAVPYEQQEWNANSEIMAVLAEGTGGTFVTNSSDFDGGFRRLAALPEYIYTLGFAPEGLKLDGSFHDLKVTVKTSGKLTVQARRGYYAPRRSEDPVEAAKQEIENAVFSRDEIHDLPVELSTQFLKAGDEARLTVLASMDARQIRFRKADGRNRNDVTVVSSLFDNNGNFIAGAQKVVQFRLRDETRKKLELGPPVTIRTVFNLKPGDYLVRLVARDAEGRQMTAQSSVVEIR